MIKSINTFYNGNYFRSRLEARWAAYFDALEIKYSYEPQGYVLANGQTYLPDFYLPEHELYVEVKPLGYNQEDQDRHIEFVRGIEKTMVVCVDIPEPKDQLIYVFYSEEFNKEYCGFNHSTVAIGEGTIMPPKCKYFPIHWYSGSDYFMEDNYMGMADAAREAAFKRFEHKK